MSDERAHGPLPVLLVGLTIVTGLVDAFSYLSLGHVFVANMTGNVVFLGFGLAGVGGISLVASLVAILAFALGAAAGGRWSQRRPPHRATYLASPQPPRPYSSSRQQSWPSSPASPTRCHDSFSSPSLRSPWAAKMRSPAASPCPT